MHASRNQWDFAKAYEGLEDGRRRKNKAAQLLPNNVRNGVQNYILDVVGNKLEINCSLLRPFVKNFVQTEFPEEHEKLFSVNSPIRDF